MKREQNNGIQDLKNTVQGYLIKNMCPLQQ